MATTLLSTFGLDGSELVTLDALQVDDASSTPPQEILIVDSRVADWQSLLQGVSSDIRVHVLQADEDGIRQISDILAQYEGLSAVHLLSHGEPGAITVGSTQLADTNIDQFAGLINGWSRSLTEKADILLYGCDVAARGDTLIQRLSQLTGADVAASADATGAAGLGGNWILEDRVGAIETSAPFDPQAVREYNHLLAPPIVNDQAFTVAENSAAGTRVGTIYAADPENDTLAYTVTGGTGQNLFNVNASTGQVTVKSGAVLNYEATNSYTLNVQVSDGSLSDTGVVTVCLADVAESGSVAAMPQKAGNEGSIPCLF